MPDELQALGRAVRQAQYRHHRTLDSRLAEAGTTLAQWVALRAIARSPGESARTLSRTAFKSEQAFGALTTRLATQGLIQRRPTHGRTLAHHLTPTGELLLAAADQIVNEVLTTSFSPLSPTEQSTLLTLLNRITQGGTSRHP